MKKWLFCISVLMLAFACVGQKDDPEDDPVIGPDPSGPVVNPDNPTAEGDYFRRSLILDFTGTWCVNCPKMEAAIQDARAQRPGRLECVSVHCLQIDNMALIPFSMELANRFGVTAYPSAVVDLDASSLITTSSPALLLSHCDRLLEARPQAAGIKVQTQLSDGRLTVAVEARTVREGDYSLHCVLLEDGIVAAQTGGSAEHVHNNVLREWMDSEVSSCAAGDVLDWTFSAEAAAGWRVVAFVCRGGTVDNVCSCAAGSSIDYQYEGKEMVFYADWEQETRTVVQPDGKVFWSPQETIGVFQGDNTQKGGYVFTSHNTEPQARTAFTGTMPSGSGDYWAVYPYTPEAFLSQTDCIVTALPDCQSGVAGSLADDLNIAVARSSNNELHFSHPLESIKFSVVSSGVKRAVLIAEDGGKLAAGQLLIGFRDGKAVIQDIYNGYNTIYLTPEEGVLVPGEAYSFITIPVQSDNGLTLALEKQDGSVLYRTVFKSLMEADSGQEYTQIRMEIENTRFEVGPAGGAISINVKYHGDIHIETAGCPFVSEAGVKETEFGRFSYSYNVEPNTGAARMGVITVCDDANCYPVFINQASAEGN